MSLRLPIFFRRKFIKAAELNALSEAIESQALTAAAPLEVQRSSTGTSIRYAGGQDEHFARISNYTTGVYSWVETVRSSTGWLDGDITGKAVEANGNAAVAIGTRVLVTRSPASPDTWVFQYRNCSS